MRENIVNIYFIFMFFRNIVVNIWRWVHQLLNSIYLLQDGFVLRNDLLSYCSHHSLYYLCISLMECAIMLIFFKIPTKTIFYFFSIIQKMFDIKRILCLFKLPLHTKMFTAQVFLRVQKYHGAGWFYFINILKCHCVSYFIY